MVIRLTLSKLVNKIYLNANSKLITLNDFHEGNRDSTYDDYLEQLKVGDGKECRYGVYDYEYKYQHQGTLSVNFKTLSPFRYEM